MTSVQQAMLAPLHPSTHTRCRLITQRSRPVRQRQETDVLASGLIIKQHKAYHPDYTSIGPDDNEQTTMTGRRLEEWQACYEGRTANEKEEQEEHLVDNLKNKARKDRDRWSSEMCLKLLTDRIEFG